MKRLSTSIAGLLVAAVFTAGTAGAYAQVNGKAKKDNQVRFASWEEANQQFSEMQAELSSLRAQVDGVPIAEDIGWDTGCGGCSACCYQLGWFGGGELTLLVAHAGGLAVNIPALNTGDFQVTPEYDAEVAPRFWVGVGGPAGFAFRATGWVYEHGARGTDLAGAPLPDIDLPIIELPDQIDFDLKTNLDAYVLDLELTQDEYFCNWGFELGFGVRYARIKETFQFGGDDGFLALSRNAQGVGPTLGLTATRPFGCGGLALIAGARASLLFGESKLRLSENVLGDLIGDVAPDGLSGTSLSANQHLLEIYEVKFGGEWSRPMGCGRLFARAVYEAQAWELAPFVLGLLDSNIGFVGASFSLGIEW